MTAPRAGPGAASVSPAASLSSWPPAGPMGADVAAEAGVPARTLGTATSGRDHGRRHHGRPGMLAEAGADLLLFAGGDGTAATSSASSAGDVPDPRHPRRGQDALGGVRRQPRGGRRHGGRVPGRTGRPVAAADVVDVVDGGGERAGDGPFALRRTARAGERTGPGRRAPARSEELLPSSGRTLWSTPCAGPWRANSTPARCTSSAPGRRRGGSSRPSGFMAPRSASTPSGTVRSSGPTSASGAIVELMDRSPTTRLVLGVIGGQGFLLGRGNQQLGAGGAVAGWRRRTSSSSPRRTSSALCTRRCCGSTPATRPRSPGPCGLPAGCATGPARCMMMRVSGAA